MSANSRLPESNGRVISFLHDCTVLLATSPSGHISTIFPRSYMAKSYLTWTSLMFEQPPAPSQRPRFFYAPLTFSQAFPWSLDFRGKSGGAKNEMHPAMSFFLSPGAGGPNLRSLAKQKLLDGIGATLNPPKTLVHLNCSMVMPYTISRSLRSPPFLRPCIQSRGKELLHMIPTMWQPSRQTKWNNTNFVATRLRHVVCFSWQRSL